MSTKQSDAELARNRTLRLHPAPPNTDYSDRRLPQRDPVRSGLVSNNTRLSRRVRAQLRTRTGIGGTAKHRKVMLLASGEERLTKRTRTLDGSPLAAHAQPRQYVLEARATGPRPWTARNERRVANRRARASRKVNR